MICNERATKSTASRSGKIGQLGLSRCPSNLITRGTLRVLLVEDEARLRELLLAEIPEMGFSVRAAPSAEEARRLMAAEPCDILILDLQLPGMGGMEFFEQVRQHSPATPVIILTGFGHLDAARQAIHMDVVDFLTKPCRLNELESALDRACRRVRGLSPVPRVDDEQDIPESRPAAPPAADDGAPPVTLAEHERELILEALARSGGNRVAAAAELGISRRTLHYRLAEYKAQGRPAD